jgi:hypothetical protein
MNIPDELHKELKLYCVEQDLEMTELVLKLVKEFLEKERKRIGKK